jgi:flagellar basal body-associated protein FliL
MSDSPEKEGEKKAEAPKKAPLNTTNLLLIIVIGVLLLAVVGGSIAAIMIYRSGTHAAAPAPKAEGEEHAEEGDAEKGEKGKDAPKEKEEKKKDAKKDDKPKGPAIYVTLEPPFVVNFTAGKPAKFLQITMEISTRDQTAAQILKDNNPLLRNDILMLFGAQQYETVAVQEGREALRAQTLDVVRGVVKKEGGRPADIEAVYFTSFVMQ